MSTDSRYAHARLACSTHHGEVPAPVIVLVQSTHPLRLLPRAPAASVARDMMRLRRALLAEKEQLRAREEDEANVHRAREAEDGDDEEGPDRGHVVPMLFQTEVDPADDGQREHEDGVDERVPESGEVARWCQP